MVSVLTKIFGLTNIEIAEDIVHDVLLKALESWKLKGVPENPSAWLMAAAKNKTLDFLRHKKQEEKYARQITPLLQSEYTIGHTLNNYFSENEIKDDQLRMMFVCCHDSINEESQIALILKTLCGFSVSEIAKAFLTNDSTINKRLYRAKEKLRELEIKFEIPVPSEIEKRIDQVLKALYLLFNEGYSSTEGESFIREELAAEALRLCLILSQHTAGNIPKTLALLALMYFHGARFNARIDDEGNILLLKEQNRKLWDNEMIQEGIILLNMASTGDLVSTYHIEAAIAYEHCIAKSYNDTNWKNLLNYYQVLITLTKSPVAELNSAIVISEIDGPDAALNVIFKIELADELKNYYLLPATKGDLYFRKSDMIKAKYFYDIAETLTSSPFEKKLLRKKSNMCT
ncbi:MAG: sigma-70 family RNA polymerase sigma factor [Fimbriimonadaceae bacterium]|nr:sigma-70 family RNA polymerase sigma factor [Chitinophagales bacterium]